MKYFELYVNDKIINAYSIYIEGQFKNNNDIIAFCKDNNLFTEEDDYKYIEYINEINKETFVSATILSERLKNFSV